MESIAAIYHQNIWKYRTSGTAFITLNILNEDLPENYSHVYIHRFSGTPLECLQQLEPSGGALEHALLVFPLPPDYIPGNPSDKSILNNTAIISSISAALLRSPEDDPCKLRENEIGIILYTKFNDYTFGTMFVRGKPTNIDEIRKSIHTILKMGSNYHNVIVSNEWFTDWDISLDELARVWLEEINARQHKNKCLKRIYFPVYDALSEEIFKKIIEADDSQTNNNDHVATSIF